MGMFHPVKPKTLQCLLLILGPLVVLRTLYVLEEKESALVASNCLVSEAKSTRIRSIKSSELGTCGTLWWFFFYKVAISFKHVPCNLFLCQSNLKS